MIKGQPFQPDNLGALTFSLRELLATVELWDELSSPDQKIELFNHEVGKPVIVTIDADYIQSTFVVANSSASSEYIHNVVGIFPDYLQVVFTCVGVGVRMLDCSTCHSVG